MKENGFLKELNLKGATFILIGKGGDGIFLSHFSP